MNLPAVALEHPPARVVADAHPRMARRAGGGGALAMGGAPKGAAKIRCGRIPFLYLCVPERPCRPSQAPGRQDRPLSLSVSDPVRVAAVGHRRCPRNSSPWSRCPAADQAVDATGTVRPGAPYQLGGGGTTPGLWSAAAPVSAAVRGDSGPRRGMLHRRFVTPPAAATLGEKP